MKKLILFIICAILPFNIVNSGAYEIEENKYSVPFKRSFFSGIMDWALLAENRHNDCLIIYDAEHNGFLVYDYKGNLLFDELSSLVYYSDIPDGSIYVFTTYYAVQEETELYIRAKELIKEGNKNIFEKDGDIILTRYRILNHRGELLLPEEIAYEIQFENQTSMPYTGDIFIRAYGTENFYRFDKINGRITDCIRGDQRFQLTEKNGEYNFYDTLFGCYIFEEPFEAGELWTSNGKYHFILSKKGKVKLYTAKDKAEKLDVREFTDSEFSGYNFYNPNLYSLYNKKSRTKILELINDNGKIYVDEWGNIKDEQWFQDIMTPYPDRHLVHQAPKLPEGIEIKYGEIVEEFGFQRRAKDVYLQGRKIISSVGEEVTFLDGYWFYCYDIESGRAIYDIEGNFVMTPPDTAKYHIKDNCLYTAEISSDEIEIKEWKIINPAPKIYINGEFMLTDTLPRIKNGRTLVPLRAFAEMMEFQVKEPDETGRIEISKDGKTVAFTLGSLEGEKDGEKFKLEAAPEIINNRTLVPVRALAEAFECEVSWNGETTEVVIKN